MAANVAEENALRELRDAVTKQAAAEELEAFHTGKMAEHLAEVEKHKVLRSKAHDAFIDAGKYIDRATQAVINAVREAK